MNSEKSTELGKTPISDQRTKSWSFPNVIFPIQIIFTCNPVCFPKIENVFSSVVGECCLYYFGSNFNVPLSDKFVYVCMYKIKFE